MRKLLGLKKELVEQRQQLVAEQQALTHSKAALKATVHRNLTSVTALLSSFTAGAATGWLATAESTASETDDQTQQENPEQAESKAKSNSLSARIMDEATTVAVGFVMAELRSQLVELVDLGQLTGTSNSDSATQTQTVQNNKGSAENQDLSSHSA